MNFLNTDSDVMLELAKDITWHKYIADLVRSLKSLMGKEVGLKHVEHVLKSEYRLDPEVINDLMQWGSEPYTLTIEDGTHEDGSKYYSYDGTFDFFPVKNTDGVEVQSREEVESLLPSGVKVHYKEPTPSYEKPIVYVM